MGDMILEETDSSKIELNPTSSTVLVKITEGAKDYSAEEKMAETYMNKKSNCDTSGAFSSVDNVGIVSSMSRCSISSSQTNQTTQSGSNCSGDRSRTDSILSLSSDAGLIPGRTRTLSESSCDSKVSETDPGHVHIHLDNLGENFNEFQFWRVPLPELDIDLDIVDGKASNIQIRAKVRDVEHHKIYSSEMCVSVRKEGADIAEMLGTGDATSPGVTIAGATGSQETDTDTDAIETDTLSIMKPLINTCITDSVSSNPVSAATDTHICFSVLTFNLSYKIGPLFYLYIIYI